MYQKLKTFYFKGLYTEENLQQYVNHGTLTQDEMDRIIREVNKEKKDSF